MKICCGELCSRCVWYTNGGCSEWNGYNSPLDKTNMMCYNINTKNKEVQKNE